MVDYLPISDAFILFEPSIGSEEFPRRQCIMTQFFPDNTYENTESFILDLRLDALTTAVMVNPDVTEVFLIDVDGKKSHHNSYSPIICNFLIQSLSSALSVLLSKLMKMMDL